MVNIEKVTQMLNFFASKENGHLNKMKAIKLIWATDRYHLRKFGRAVSCDEYIAMKNGPVGSNAKDIAEHSSFSDDEVLSYAKVYISLDENDRFGYVSVKDVDEDVFSDSDIEAMQFVYSKLGKFDQFELVEISHAYPEWKEPWEEGQKVGLTRVPMLYEKFFLDPPPNEPNLKLLKYADPFNLTDEEVHSSSDVYARDSKVIELWN